MVTTVIGVTLIVLSVVSSVVFVYLLNKDNTNCKVVGPHEYKPVIYNRAVICTIWIFASFALFLFGVIIIVAPMLPATTV